VRGLFSRFSFLYDFIVYVVVLGAGLARNYFVRYQAKLNETRRLEAEATKLRAEAAELHAQVTDARLNALRTQLNPHFLFNTLNAVSTLVDEDPPGARRMIARLSDLLRHTLGEGDEQEITLASELEMLRLYLDIMEVRFRTSWRCPSRRGVARRRARPESRAPSRSSKTRFGTARADADCRARCCARRARRCDLVLTCATTAAGLRKEVHEGVA